MVYLKLIHKINKFIIKPIVLIIPHSRERGIEIDSSHYYHITHNYHNSHSSPLGITRIGRSGRSHRGTLGNLGNFEKMGILGNYDNLLCGRQAGGIMP